MRPNNSNNSSACCAAHTLRVRGPSASDLAAASKDPGTSWMVAAMLREREKQCCVDQLFWLCVCCEYRQRRRRGMAGPH